MRIINLIVIAFCVLVLNSCRDNRTTQERVEDRNPLPQNENVDRTGTTTSDHLTARDRDMTQLYGYLNMSQEQIDAYEQMEMEYRTQSGTNDHQSLSNWEIRRDQFLRDILTTEQYQRYEQWKRDNPNRNTN
jgi:hypothetical protein